MNNTTAIEDSVGFLATLSAWISLFSVLGLLSNSVTLYLVFLCKSRKRLVFAFLANQCLADLGVLFLVAIPTVLMQNWSPARQACHVLGGFTMYLLEVSLINYAGMAVHRCVVITCSRSFSERIFYRPTSVAAIITVIWLTPFLYILPPYLNFGTFGYNFAFGTCLFLSCDKPSYLYVLIFGCIAVGLPSIGTSLTAYLVIWRAYWQSRRRVAEQQQRPAKNKTQRDQQPKPQVGNAQQQQRVKGQQLDDKATTQQAAKTERQQSDGFRLAKNLCTIWMLFMVCWGPIILSTLVDSDCQVSVPLTRTFFALALTASAVNPTISLITNRNLRAEWSRAHGRHVGESIDHSAM